MDSRDVQFRILGPLKVSVNGRTIHLGGRRPQTTMAALLLAEGRVVPVERLVDLVWGETPPPSVRGQVAIAISVLRKAIRQAGGDPELIETVGAGYRLRAVQLDATEAEDRIGLARAAAGEGRTAEAVTLMRRALAMWRGPALADLGPLPGASRWDELHLAAAEECVQLELRLGRHQEVVAELTRLLAEHPLRERSRCQLMLALYRSGRRSEALGVYREGQKIFADELGLEPGQELREMERAIQANSPTLDLTPARKVGKGPRPAELPAAATGFVGREGELERVQRLASTGLPIVTITGQGGLGKSALAVRAARRVSGEYPDGQLYVDLRGSTPGMTPLRSVEVLGRFLRSLGVDNSDIPSGLDEAAARFRSLTTHLRLLVLLDNATSVEQIRPLVPAGAGCMVIVTGRSALTTLDGAVHLHLGAMEPEEAVSLLAKAIGDDRVAREPDAAAEIARLCGGLPLAVRIVAARAAAHPRWSLEDLVGTLAHARTRLDSLEYADLAVRTSFALSLQRLREGPGCERAAELFSLLGLLDAHTYTPAVAAALLDSDEQAAACALDCLDTARLIEQTSPGRYGMHDLIRLYAKELADSQGALHRAAHHYLATAVRVRELMAVDALELAPAEYPPLELADRAAAIAWLDAELDNLVSIIPQLLDLPGRYALGLNLCLAVTFPLFTRGRSHELLALHRHLLQVAERAGDRTAQAEAYNSMGMAAMHLGRFDDGALHFEKAAALWRELGRADKHARALSNLSIPYRRLGRTAESMDCNRQAIALFQELGDRGAEAANWDSLGLSHRALGRLDDAFAALERALVTRRELGQEREVAMSLTNLAETHAVAGDTDRALERFEQARQMAVATGSRFGEAVCEWGLGQACHAQGRDGPARQHWETAIAILVDINHLSREEAARLREQPVPETPRGLG